jgi:hypothetical protein
MPLLAVINLSTQQQTSGRNQMAKTRKRDSLRDFANSLTSEQYLKIVEIAHGPIPQEFRDMTDDELLSALTE